MGTDNFTASSPGQGAGLTHATVPEDAQRVRISFCGEIDLSSADMVEAAVIDALRSYHPGRIDVDLAEVKFLDSIGIRALLRCRTQAIEAGCQLAVMNPQPMIHRILEVTGVL